MASSMRLGGLVSGLDTDYIVKQMMSLERSKVDKVAQQKQLSLWKRDQYREINRKLANFVIDAKASLGLTKTTSTGLTMNAGKNAMNWAKKATASNEDAVSLTASAGAVNGTYNVKINNLASNWSAASSDKISTSTSRSSMSAQFGLEATDSINFTIEGNGKTFTFDKLAGDTTTLEMVRDINAADLGVTAIYDSAADRFFLQTNATGTENSIKITDNSIIGGGTGGFITGDNSVLKLQTADSQGAFTAVQNGIYTGVDASIDFGAATNITFSTNNFTLNNIEFSLKEATATSFQVVVDADIDSAYDKIKEVIDNYNKILDEIDLLTGQKRNSTYLPPTDEEKEQLTDKQLEQWEDRAKTGLLSRDSLLLKIAADARTGFYQNVKGVSGEYSNITQIGITTESYSAGSSGGRMQIDESKLKEALRNDIDGVMDLLFKEVDSSLTGNEDNLTSAQIQEKRAQSGIFNRLFDNLTVGMKTIVSQAGPGDDSTLLRKVNSYILLDFVANQSSISILDKGITEYNDRISNLERLLSSKEEAYWKKYSAMEQALYSMQSQMNSLTQQLGL